ncbi:bifunctional [glutamate--ammonia ligase]-adenylyl-L-tyrosine phosphorylase/[glutamate--ammonia-ligase] adenylyltransferase [Gilvimarinus chinensis]|uniref:bifunctional [glutamate--ammonia ligase]-adenylyl-L-tyrosine phosphorylase/[glutamate--ammonia-ligase] adenylyltransferase n=1 Tax=Gilvimarinus chinensis TaxID=396005 RepID=UPI00037B1BA7|nr:bifunctional [glutamate--ammonia ligase]-adenylyl-L-tyrosine phosphorylase/[glutamate--ammonia-ligase] adenylyltransferase [Gilvimarinus chinensis]
MSQHRPLPDPLAAVALRYREQLAETCDLQSLIKKAPESFSRQLDFALAGSEFIAQTCARNPQHLQSLVESGELFASQSQEQLTSLSETLDSAEDEAELDRRVRLARNRAMVRIIWRDLNRMASMTEITAELSAFADTVIQACLDWHYRALVQRFGEPVGRDSGQVQSMIVLGMGKLGACELNVSSDIDLIFAYPESGETNGERKTLSNQEFFVRLGQKLIKTLDAQTADGFVFRVDMRLRPHGQSGALVQNFDAMEGYYQSQGRDWERYAMIKARPVAWSAGGQAAADELMQTLAPFTYRQYVDFSVIESLRDMKGLINRQVQRKGMDLDVKLGEGGIREVEFVVQLFQLIRGGKEKALRERQVCKLLPLLEKEKYLPSGSGEALLQAYIFLRNTEHAIQGYQDRQTQSLPMDEEGQRRLAFMLGFDSWAEFYEVLSAHRTLVNEEFQAVIADPDAEAGVDDAELANWLGLWDGTLAGAEASAFLAEQGFADPDTVMQWQEELKTSRQVLAMQASSRTRLDAFVPRLLACVASQEEIDRGAALKRILPFVQAVARRSAYLVLLVENPTALNQLVQLSAVSPWIADQLAQHPILLDELLTPESLYSPPDKDALRDELRRELLRLGWDDLEGHMESLRYFRSAHALRVAASEVTGALPLMKVSDYLTYIAEVILEHVLALAWEQMVSRHGFPAQEGGGEAREPELCILGYGKLGGIELGHGSDLDLVFVHNTWASGATGGEKSVDNLTFYTRLGQRIIHILNTQTVSGQLYEVDMRLRPSGNSGMLVASIGAFEKYQENEAWTWEHQALVRARPVAGSESLAAEFEAVRGRVLQRDRNLAKLRGDVIDMREKMRSHLGTAAGREEFHLKQDGGGIVDIEFMVQYAVLAWAHKAPALTRYTDNIRILETLAQEALLPEAGVLQLIDAYKAYRSTGHRLALQHQQAVLQGTDVFAAERKQVTDMWRQLLLDPEAS